MADSLYAESRLLKMPVIIEEKFIENAQERYRISGTRTGLAREVPNRKISCGTMLMLSPMI